ncbi:hypothetical protein BN1195_02773 [Chryseobacterium oranimense G311]|nr:hypothetical protein BN1195_02773 [Chryseobacterium oranimense G311]
MDHSKLHVLFVFDYTTTIAIDEVVRYTLKVMK